MSEPRIVVLEKRSRWCPELQRQLELQRVVVSACRSVADVRSRIGSAPVERAGCVVVVDLEFGVGSCLTLVPALAQSGVAGIVCVGVAGAELLEPSLRELGATSMHFPPVSGDRLARECLRIVNVAQ